MSIVLIAKSLTIKLKIYSLIEIDVFTLVCFMFVGLLSQSPVKWVSQ